MRTEPVEANAGGSELASGRTGAAQPAQAFPVRGAHACELERPLLNARQREGVAERIQRLAVRCDRRSSSSTSSGGECEPR